MTQSSDPEEKETVNENTEAIVDIQPELETAAETDEEGSKAPEREPLPITITDVELERLQREARDYKDKYLRLLAESENARKRLTKEKDGHLQHAVANVLVEFINPLDQMEKALGFATEGSDEVRNWAVGFEMILNQFKEVLDSKGVEPMVSLGRQFDPHLHEAVEVLETDEQAEGLIVEEFTRGYMLGERTLRPARVKVTRAPIVETEAPKETTHADDSEHTEATAETVDEELKK